MLAVRSGSRIGAEKGKEKTRLNMQEFKKRHLEPTKPNELSVRGLQVGLTPDTTHYQESELGVELRKRLFIVRLRQTGTVRHREPATRTADL
jgi:hypothetical protein